MLKCTTLLLSTLLLMVSQNVYGSKARLQALSQGENGSLFIEDKRNVFLNPAKAFQHGKWANFEWGASATPSTPNAEGGIFYELGSNMWGLQLGRESNAQARVDTANAITPAATFNFLPPQNTINLHFAHKANVTWGLQALYGSAQDDSEISSPGGTAYPNRKANTLELGAGAVGDYFDVYAKLDLQYSSESQTSATMTHKLESKPGVEIGGTYRLANSDKVYAKASSGGFDARYSDNSVSKEVRLSNYLVGYAHYLNPDSDTKFYLSPALEIDNTKISDGNDGMPQNNELFRVPITIGMEMTATDWMVLRASVYQRVIVDDRKTTVTDRHNTNSTFVGAGVGLSWKKLIVDGTLRGAVLGSSTTTGVGQIDGNYLLGNVGMTYTF